MRILNPKSLTSLFAATLLLAAQASADLLDVQEHNDRGTHNIEVKFSTPLKLEKELVSENTNELRLLLHPQDDDAYRSWSSSRIDISEPNSMIERVTLEGSRSSGVEMRILFNSAAKIELLPQYTDSHVLLANIQPAGRSGRE